MKIVGHLPQKKAVGRVAICHWQKGKMCFVFIVSGVFYKNWKILVPTDRVDVDRLIVR